MSVRRSWLSYETIGLVAGAAFVVGACGGPNFNGLFDRHAPNYEYVAVGPAGPPCASIDLEVSGDTVGPRSLGASADEWIPVADLRLQDVDDTGYLVVSVTDTESENEIADLRMLDEWAARFAVDALERGVGLWAGVQEGRLLTIFVQRPTPNAALSFVTLCEDQDQATETLNDLVADTGLPDAAAVVEAILDGRIRAD